VAPLIAISAEALLTRSARADTVSIDSAAQALVPARPPAIAMHDAARRQTLLFMRSSLLVSFYGLEQSPRLPAKQQYCRKTQVYRATYRLLVMQCNKTIPRRDYNTTNLI
jgi:hypothetical protein